MMIKRESDVSVVQEWQRLQAAACLSLKQLLLLEQARTGLTVPKRGKAQRREVGPML